MKKYDAYVAKNMVGYFESELAKRGVIIVGRESVNDGELYYYVLEANDGIIDPKFEIKGRKLLLFFLFSRRNL